MNDHSPLRSTVLATRVTVRSDAKGSFAAWQAELTYAAAGTAGFVSIEITPFGEFSGWTVIERFRTHAALASWRASAPRTTLFAELAAMTETADDSSSAEPALDLLHLACVTEAITTLVQPGREQAHLDWARNVQAAQATFPGYAGTLVQAPMPPDIPHWTALIRFTTSVQLEAWLGSAERKALLKCAGPKISTWKSWRVPDPFGVWFAPPHDRVAYPPAWKQAALVLLVLFPIVMLEIRFLTPFLTGRHPVVATFIGNAVSVALTSWPLMPLAVFCMRWWLRPAPPYRWAIEIAGLGTLAALYAIEIATFLSLS